MTPADQELCNSIFRNMIEYDAEQYKKMFDKTIQSYYTNEDVSNFIRRESENRIKLMHTVKGDVVKIEY